MVNIDDFVKRLEIVLEYYGLNASAFADKIGVQRSSMSHLLSGRNKPSLDFVMKIVEVFPDLDLYWLLIGKGNFPNHHDNNADSSPVFSTGKKADSTVEMKNTEENEIKNFSDVKNDTLEFKENEIEKIIVFYKNGTFKAYKS